MLDRALYFMDDAMSKDQPFFLYFTPTPPHLPSVEDALLGHFTPYQTPAGTLESAPDISRYCSSCKLATRKEIWDSVKDISSLSEKASCRHLLAALRWLDESLGVLYDFLSERDALGNTYIVMSTDHGSGKFSLYELGTRVPLYAAGPGIQAGTVVHEPVIHMDMAPTFLSWAGDPDGASMPMPVEGLSWASLASGEASSLDRESITTEAYFDTASVTREGMKVYSCKTRSIIQVVLGKMRDPMLIEEASSAAKNLAVYVGDAYPFLYEPMQVYNLSSDPMEQESLWRGRLS
jgi:arylsulfatase A-like enzyme